jgi:hypothetical protein
MDTGIQLGRRFRALKLWMVLRHFGAEGLRARLSEHMRLAHLFAGWVDSSDRFVRVAPVPFSVVCFRAKGDDGFNQRLLDAVNAGGQVFLSHTKLDGRFVLRLAIGHIRTTEEHVAKAWSLLQREADLLQRADELRQGMALARNRPLSRPSMSRSPSAERCRIGDDMSVRKVIVTASSLFITLVAVPSNASADWLLTPFVGWNWEALPFHGPRRFRG